MQTLHWNAVVKPGIDCPPTPSFLLHLQINCTLLLSFSKQIELKNITHSTTPFTPETRWFCFAYFLGAEMGTRQERGNGCSKIHTLSHHHRAGPASAHSQVARCGSGLGIHKGVNKILSLGSHWK